MKFRNVLFVGFLFASLAVYVAVFERHQKTSDEREKQNLSVLRLRGADVSELVLELSEEPIALEKKEGRWFVRLPRGMEADADTVEALLCELEFLKADRIVSPADKTPLDLAQYGLMSSAKKVKIKTLGEEQVLVFGNKTPIGKSVYGMIEGKPEVYVVAENLLQNLYKKPEDLRNRVVLAFNLDEIVSLTLSNPGGVFEVEPQKSDSGVALSTWNWKKPLKGSQVNQEALSSILWELRRLKFSKYLGEQKEQPAVWENPVVKIAVALKGQNAPKVLLVANRLPDGSFVAKMEEKPDVFTLESYQVEPFKKDLAKPLEEAADAGFRSQNPGARMRAPAMHSEF